MYSTQKSGEDDKRTRARTSGATYLIYRVQHEFLKRKSYLSKPLSFLDEVAAKLAEGTSRGSPLCGL